MQRRLLVSILALSVALLVPAGVLAQEYLFGVDRETVDVFWNLDGSASLEYTFNFVNQPGAHAIDFVDVGMPVNSFDMSTASADVDGIPVEVSRGEYQGSGSGFAVVMGSRAIPPGGSGAVHVVVGRITQVLRSDTSDDTFASAVFAPTYFDSQFVVGSTNLIVTFHLPPGVQPEEPRYHPAEGWPGEAQPQPGFDDQGRITYTWAAPAASAARQYTFGASFPKSYVPADAIVTPPPIDIGAIVAGLMGVLLPAGCIGIFVVIFLGVPILAVIQGQRRKLQYLPPKISIEGHGIKRGLTAVEAAILLEQPLDKVLTMMLFGTIKKGAATVLSREPLEISAAEPLPDGLQPYEKDLIEAFKVEDARERRKRLERMVIALVKSVSEKMKGFSRKETQEYYKGIMEKAWSQVEAAKTPEVKGQRIDENIEWTMLDPDYDDRSRRVFSGPIFAPLWWGRYDPAWRPASGTGSGAGRPAAPSLGQGSALPGADLAASVVGGVQGFSTRVLGDLNAFTGRVTNVTNPPPPPSRSSFGGGGGGGGRSCACACACAGCACACAGGGR